MISNKCYYALRAMIELAKREGEGPATIVDIAHAQHIPARFLEAILRELKQAGLTDSVRGKKGGYILAKPARAITMGDVIHLMEGPLLPLEQPSAKGGPRRARKSHDVLASAWQQAESALNQVYDSINFAELAEQDRMAGLQHVADYSI